MPEQNDNNNTVLQAILSLTKTISEIQTELAVNTTETKNIVNRLDKLNGSVAKHEASISLNEQAIALLTQTITAITKTSENNSRARSTWLDWLLKGVVVILLLLFYKLTSVRLKFS